MESEGNKSTAPIASEPDPEVAPFEPRRRFGILLAALPVVIVISVTIVGYSGINSRDECTNLLANYLALTAFDCIAILLIILLYIGAHGFKCTWRFPEAAKRLAVFVAFSVAFAWGCVGFYLITSLNESECGEDFEFTSEVTRTWVLLQLVWIPMAFGLWIRDTFVRRSRTLTGRVSPTLTDGSEVA